MPNDLNNRTLAGIVTYNPEIERLQQNMEAVLRNGINRIVVVDNGSKNAEEISVFLEYFPEAYIINNPKNEGIAHALNQIFQEAYDSGCYEWVLTLDQDSVIDDNMLEVYEKYAKDEDVVSLTTPQRDRNFELNRKPDERETQYIKRCITSGNLVRTAVWKEVGGFDDRLFIDSVDHEFCYRLREHGYQILQINTPLILHEVGKATIVNFLGKPRLLLNHSAFRKYYLIRNRAYLLKAFPLAWECDDYLNIVKFMLKTVLLEKDDKWNKLRSMVKGYHDGLKMQRLY